jgi:molybdopterin-guanine dinucleotide biosynthesis protein A
VAAGRAEVEPAAAIQDVPVAATADGPGAGPAAGLLGVARARPGQDLLVLACDLPLVPVELLVALASSRADVAAAASDPADRWTMNPTCALWKPRALESLERRVAAGDFRLYPTLQDPCLRVRAIDAGSFGDPKRVLLNVNTADDWDSACRAFLLAPNRL